MLRVSIYTGVWVFAILLSVASVSITVDDNNVQSSTNDSYRYHHDYYYRRNNGQLRNVNSRNPSIEYILEDFQRSLNETSKRDSPITTFETKRNAKSTESIHDPDYSQNPIESSCNSATNFFVASNGTSPESRRVDHRSDPVDYLWKRRTLCSLSDDGQHPYRKTLPNLNGPAFADDVEDPDSLKTLVRVKRTGSGLNSPYRQDYVKDLADSFPQSSYEYIDENDNGELSFDAKREANSLDYYVKNDRFVESDSEETSKNLNDELLSGNDDGLNKLSDDEKSSYEQTSGGSLDKEKLVEKNGRSVAAAESREPSKDHVETVEQRNTNSETVLKDPPVSVELVRRKRNDRGKTESKRSLEKESPAKANEEDSSVEVAEKLFEEKKQAHSADKLEEPGEQCRKPSSLALADLTADLLRFKRKARNERREKSYKSKKKKKHAGKKHNDSKSKARRSRKIVRSKHAQRPRSARNGKNSDARVDGKSHVGFSKLASKTNNQNNFRRRSVSPVKPFDNVSGNDRAALRDATQDTLTNVVETNANNLDNSAISMTDHQGGDEASKGSDESLNSLMERVEQEIHNGNLITEDTKARTKRDKTADSRHGFLSDEDELQYYENIREFEPSTECDVQDDGSANNEKELGRAVRSIEEVKDLAKKLVTKVDELENYLSIDEAKRNDRNAKRIEIRAIDDLCSNVTATCADFKETSEIIQRCVPTSTAKVVADKKIRKKDANSRVKQKKENFTMKKRSSQENNAKTLSEPSKNSRRETDKSQKWGRWTDWSSCSVTCGKGRQIRWRYCLHDCTVAETEMEEKACQLPACPPGKFLGIF